MLLNDARGSYGMYSRAGRNTAEKFHLLMRKDEILSGNTKKVYVKGQFNPDDYTKSNEEDEEVDIFNLDNKNKKDREIKNINPVKHKANQRSVSQPKQPPPAPKKNIVKKLDMPTCTKYNPKFDYVWKRCLTGPTWDKSIRRNFSAKPKDETTPEFYLSHTELKIQGKNMVEYARMTTRDTYRTTSPDSASRNHSKEKDLQETENLPTVSSTGNALTETKDTTRKVVSATAESEEAEKGGNKVETKKKRYQRIHAPDFRKTISRDQLDKLNGDKRTVIPFTLPNFKWTRERPIVLVSYNKMLMRKAGKMKEIHEAPNTYDPDKILDKVNNHIKPMTPNFNLMTSRPMDEGPLPSYMKKIYNKQSANLLTEESLKMNNFADGKFSNTTTCFWPKKTFNKIINLNLMNSTKFKENLGLNSEMKNTEVDNYIQKSMRFYNKNFDELMKESLLTKFDNVTYKTIKKASKLENGDLEKFLVSFDKGDL